MPLLHTYNLGTVGGYEAAEQAHTSLNTFMMPLPHLLAALVTKLLISKMLPVPGIWPFTLSLSNPATVS